MSKQSENQDRQVANFTGLILVFTFVIIFMLISANGSPVRSVSVSPTNESVPAVAQVVPTETIQATATPMPPTATATTPPTPTSAPTSTPLSSATPLATEAEAVQVAEGSQQSQDPVTDVSYDPALVAQGQTLFLLCAACHGPDARGIQNLGKDLVASEFVAGHNDQELLDFIKTGRPIWDAENTTGIDMPPKGGNPALTDEDIIAIIAYLRSLAANAE